MFKAFSVPSLTVTTMADTLQHAALIKADAAQRILIVCPAGDRDHWETLCRYHNPDKRPFVVRAVGEGVNTSASVIIGTHDMMELHPHIHRALMQQSYDAVILDRVPAAVGLLSKAKLVINIPDRVGAVLETYKRLQLAA